MLRFIEGMSAADLEAFVWSLTSNERAQFYNVETSESDWLNRLIYSFSFFLRFTITTGGYKPHTSLSNMILLCSSRRHIISCGVYTRVLVAEMNSQSCASRRVLEMTILRVVALAAEQMICGDTFIVVCGAARALVLRYEHCCRIMLAPTRSACRSLVDAFVLAQVLMPTTCCSVCCWSHKFLNSDATTMNRSRIVYL